MRVFCSLDLLWIVRGILHLLVAIEDRIYICASRLRTFPLSRFHLDLLVS